jgi:hypothetical protein
VISIIFIVLAAICNAIMDNVLFHYYKSIFRNSRFEQWSNADISWMNKWKNGDITQGERFPFSSTIFVWTTDLWHFAQSLMITFFVLAAIFYSPTISFDNYIIEVVVSLVVLKATFSLTFELFLSKILVK